MLMCSVFFFFSMAFCGGRERDLRWGYLSGVGKNRCRYIEIIHGPLFTPLGGGGRGGV